MVSWLKGRFSASQQVNNGVKFPSGIVLRTRSLNSKACRFQVLQVLFKYYISMH